MRHKCVSPRAGTCTPSSGPTSVGIGSSGGLAQLYWPKNGPLGGRRAVAEVNHELVADNDDLQPMAVLVFG